VLLSLPLFFFLPFSLLTLPDIREGGFITLLPLPLLLCAPRPLLFFEAQLFFPLANAVGFRLSALFFFLHSLRFVSTALFLKPCSLLVYQPLS
jgi:hypothetical protein